MVERFMDTTASAIGYDPILVTLSIAIASFAGYTALELGDRASLGTGRMRSVWIAVAAAAMGGGIWSMHFVGMLAVRWPVPVAYDLGRTILSLLVAIGATAAAFFWINKKRPASADGSARLVGAGRIGIAGLLMGGAIAGMHYIGMSAMQMPMDLGFATGRVVLSVLIAIVASVAGLSIAFRRQSIAMRIAAAMVIGLAVSGMHYTGMWAAHFTPERAAQNAPMPGMSAATVVSAGNVGPAGLVLSVVLATFLILFLALLASNLTQQRAQRLLRQSDLRFRVAAEAVGDIIWTNSPEGRMVGEQEDWSRFTGQQPAEYDGYGWSTAIHPDDLAPTLEAWADAVANRRRFEFEHRVRRVDGSWRVCSVRALPMLDEVGVIVGWVGVHEDITERRDAEIELRAARDRPRQPARSRATSSPTSATSSARRFRPSSAIPRSSWKSTRTPRGVPRCSRTWRRSTPHARHLLGLINDLLDLTKIEAGRMDVSIQPVDVAALLRGVESTVRPLVERRANRLRLVLPAVPITMHTDATKLRQMLLNLLGNAAKFTEGGTVTLAVDRDGVDGSTIVFDVTDTGIGMTAEQTSRLFERFTQADASTTRRFGGTGLGLALTKAYLSLVGGAIRVRSAEGVGSTFTLIVPAVYRPHADGPTRDDEAGQAEPGHVMTASSVAASRR